MDSVISWLKEFSADNLSGFSINDLPNFLFTLFLAAIWVYALRYVYLRKSDKTEADKSFAKRLILVAMITAVVVTIVRYSIPLAIVFAGLLALTRFKNSISNFRDLTYLYAAVAVGIGCGAGYAVLVSIGFIPVLIGFFLLDQKTSN